MGGGEIVEVQGGHIVRSTGRNDRHSKVCTAKGPRDRRVRLSAHTAIQFYDVQDRLGYDRPSKAVDWLIKKAKNAIDQLDHLPPWNPIPQEPEPTTTDRPDSNFLPPSLDSDSIADTIKSFFPVVSGEQPMTAGSSGLQFQQLHSSQSQDLRLSLQSLQDSSSIFHHHQNSEHIASFGWPDHGNHSHHNQSFVFNSPEFCRSNDNNNQNSHKILFGSSSSSSQRGPLQSSNNTPSVRANWIESSNQSQSQPLSMADQIQNTIHHNQHHHHQLNQVDSSSAIGMGFGAGIFSGGFHHHFPERFQGEEEHHGGADKPSSASSDSRH